MEKSRKRLKDRGWYKKLSSRLDKLISIGIVDELLDWEKKRTRLLNGISWMLVFLYFVFILIFPHDPLNVYLDVVLAFFCYFIPLVLNYFKKYSIACHFFIQFNLFLYTFFALQHGDIDGAEYILVGCSIFPLLLFRSQRISNIYFVLTLLCFLAAKLSFVYTTPYFKGVDLYFNNMNTLFLYIFLIVYYFKSINKRQENLLEQRNVNITEAKKKTDELLLNILPHETAEELKQYGFAKSQYYDLVTVLFTDFKGFTKVAEQLTPEKLVAEINDYFVVFDSIITKYGIEKIKTIGDSYMCAGGVPGENQSTAQDVILAALEIQAYLNEHKQQKIAAGETYFEARLGIHTGPVVAGIVGVKKFAYDIWGDTVNTASRMESNGEVGKVNISGSTFDIVKDEFDCVYRGKVAAKGKGEIDMYFVNGVKK